MDDFLDNIAFNRWKELLEENNYRKRKRLRLSLGDEIFCAIQKAYSQLSSRRAESLYEFAESRN